jgi:hypothetical protein
VDMLVPGDAVSTVLLMNITREHRGCGGLV